MGKQWKKEGKILKARQKGRLFHKLAKEIQAAAIGRGLRLERALAAAKEHSLPKETIQRALSQAADRRRASSPGQPVLYEGFAPHRTAVLMEAETDNRARLAARLREAFRKHKGVLGDAGSALHLFGKGALATGRRPRPFDLEIEAIEAGASQCFAHKRAGDEGLCSFFAPLKDLSLLKSALAERGWRDLSARPFYLRKAKQEGLSLRETEEVRFFLEELLQQPDIVHVYSAIDDF